MCLPAPALPLPRPSPPGPGLPFALALARTAETTCSTEVRNCAAAVEIEWAMRDVADLPLAADAAWSLARASATISPITSETSGKYFIACPLRCHIRILWSEAASNAACFCSSPHPVVLQPWIDWTDKMISFGRIVEFRSKGLTTLPMAGLLRRIGPPRKRTKVEATTAGSPPAAGGKTQKSRPWV